MVEATLMTLFVLGIFVWAVGDFIADVATSHPKYKKKEKKNEKIT